MKRLLSWNGWPPVFVVAVVLVTWQAATALFDIPKWMLPSPLAIVQEAWSIYPRLTVHTWASIKIALSGFAIGVSFGLLLAFALHLVPKLKQGVYPLIILSQNVPIIALAPLLVLWFGFGLLPKIIIITLVCFFPIAVSMLDGFLQTDRTLLNYMRMAGASRRQIFFKLELPNSLPYLFSGLKISATYSVMGAVIAEWLGAQEGLGTFMTLSASSFRTDRVFVAIFIIMVMSLVLFGFILLLEKWFIRWKPAQTEGQR